MQMISLYTACRRLKQQLPEQIIRSPVLNHIFKLIAHRIVSFDQIYTHEYFVSEVESTAGCSAQVISESIIKGFKPIRVVDVGCGTGALLYELKERGCVCLGLENSRAGLNICRTRGLDVRKFDLEHDTLEKEIETFDVTICMEVAEHLPEKYANRLIDLLTTLSPIVVFTAATPGQGGKDHVNEKPHDYWIDKFESRGFWHDRMLSQAWSHQWEIENVVEFYQRNLMIFCQTGSQKLTFIQNR